MHTTTASFRAGPPACEDPIFVEHRAQAWNETTCIVLYMQPDSAGGGGSGCLGYMKYAIRCNYRLAQLEGYMYCHNYTITCSKLKLSN